MSHLEKARNIAQKRRYREHEFGGFAEVFAAAVILRCVADRITNTTQKCMH